MERIVENKPEVVTLLKVQYRMNEEIMRFSSDWFYGGQVETAPQIKYRGILDYDNPMVWIDTSDEAVVASYDLTESEANSVSSQLNNDKENAFHEQFVGSSFGRIKEKQS